MKLSPAQEAAMEVIRTSGRVSVSYAWDTEKIHVTDRRGHTIDGRTWAALVRKGLVRYTGEWDHIGQWWVEA